MEFNLEQLIRVNIRKMTPYSSARHEFSGTASVFLDANENAFGSPLPESYNRYPDPLQQNLKDKISSIKGVPSENIFLGNGSDEAIDLLFRIFCEPGKDNVIIFPPTYGMYEVCAEVNNVEVRKVPLLENYQLNLDAAEQAVDENTKLIFVCSPNNPTGNSIYKPGRSRQPKGVDKDRIALAEAMELTDVPDPKRCWKVSQISVRSPMPIMTRTECLRSCAKGGWFSRYRHGSPM